MSKFLDDFLVTMPSAQRKKLMELLELKKRSGIIKSEQELEKELERLLHDINERNGQPTFEVRHQGERVESEPYNVNLNEIAFDLMTLFDASETIERLLMDNKQLSRSLLSNMRKQIHNIRARIDKYQMLIKNSDGFVDGIFEQFKSPEFTEADEKVLSVLRKGRFDAAYSSLYNAEVIGGGLQLAGIETLDQLKTNYGRKLAKASVRNRIGSAESADAHSVGKAIDGSLNTFWAETVLVDEPIVQDIGEIWEHDYKNYPKDGAMCEMEITLNGITTVSDIQIDPYCAFPLEVVSIYGYERESYGGEVYALITPDHPNIRQRSKKSVDLMTFQFPSVDISRIRILFRQENYIKENFIINQEDIDNREMWKEMTKREDLISDYKDLNETMAQFNKRNRITGWEAYLTKLKEWAKKVNKPGVVESAKQAMHTIRAGDYKNPMLLALQAMSPHKQKEIKEDHILSSEWKATNKLSYLYGAYNISVFGRKYQDRSMYITKPLPLSSNATLLSLETDEKHHDIEVGPEQSDPSSGKPSDNHLARITDIEYYITYAKNPGISDWKSILPIGKKTVKGELLQGDAIGGPDVKFEQEKIVSGYAPIKYSLRFQAASTTNVVLRRNGIPMNPSAYVVTDDGRRIGIKKKFYSASSIYTVDYKPTEDAYLIKIDGQESTPSQYIDDNGETGELFLKADQNNTVTLKHKPYLYRKELFEYEEEQQRHFQDESTFGAHNIHFPIIVHVDGEEYQNITNYEINTYDPDRLSENDGKTFAQIGNKIVFGTPTDGSTIQNINVDYYYLMTDIRLKAILRRNSSAHESMTPVVYSYNLKCQSYDLKE